MSASNVQPALTTTGLPMDFVYDVSAKPSIAETSIDDPVNDTGLGPQRGDLHCSDEFAGLVEMLCERSGEFS